MLRRLPMSLLSQVIHRRACPYRVQQLRRARQASDLWSVDAAADSIENVSRDSVVVATENVSRESVVVATVDLQVGAGEAIDCHRR